MVLCPDVSSSSLVSSVSVVDRCLLKPIPDRVLRALKYAFSLPLATRFRFDPTGTSTTSLVARILSRESAIRRDGKRRKLGCKETNTGREMGELFCTEESWETKDNLDAVRFRERELSRSWYLRTKYELQRESSGEAGWSRLVLVLAMKVMWFIELLMQMQRP